MYINWGLLGFLGTLLAICVAVAIYQRSQRNIRIDNFINSFFDIYQGNGHILEVLIPAGIVNLKNDGEIETALEKLKNRLGIVHHPLRQWNDDIKKIGYKKFFQRVANGPGKLKKNSIQVYINSWKNE